MFGLRSPFGRREGVPHKDAAMAALGVDEKGSKGFKGDRGSKGSEDEIRLSAQEKKEVEKSESIWDREDMIEWAKTIGNDEKYNEAWVDETFEFLPDGKINCKNESLLLNNTQVKEIPPGLQIDELDLSDTSVREIPVGFKAKTLYLAGTPIERIPDDVQVENLNLTATRVEEIPATVTMRQLFLADTPIRRLPEGLQVRELDLRNTHITEIPIDKGAIEVIWIDKKQTILRKNAEERGIRIIDV